MSRSATALVCDFPIVSPVPDAAPLFTPGTGFDLLFFGRQGWISMFKAATTKSVAAIFVHLCCAECCHDRT